MGTSDVQDELPVELLEAGQMQRVDAAALAGGTDGYRLMRAAGAAVHRAALELVRDLPERRVTVVAGPGNNGGDGVVAARLLRASGCRVQLLLTGLPAGGSDAARAVADWGGPTPVLGGELAATVAELEPGQNDLVIDALLGAGLSRPVDGVIAALIGMINSSSAPVLAVDLPSGLDGDTHRADGAVVRASATITFVRYKPAHLLYPGRELCGRLMLADIGMPTAAIAAVASRCSINRPALWHAFLTRPQGRTHKFRRGHVLVRGGGAAHGGAARLSAMTALSCGAGLVTLGCPASATLVNACHLNAVMLARLDGADELDVLLQDPRIGTLLIGPGNGRNESTRQAVERALGSGRDCVLDADALTAHGSGAERLVAAIGGATAQVVLTPHAGEFDRLFGAPSQDPAPSRLHRAREASRRSGAVVVFKGADTVVAAPDGRASIACHAPAWLATAGSGDVLAGAVAALLAQGAPAFEAASAAVWLHGQAGRTLGYPLTAEALVSGIADELGHQVAASPPAPLGWWPTDSDAVPSDAIG